MNGSTQTAATIDPQDEWLADLQTLAKLQSLEIGDGFSEAGVLQLLKRTPNLASLEVDSVRFTPQGIVALAKLEMLTTLNLTNAELSDGDVGALSKLNESKKTKLIELNIQGNGITRDGVQRIQDALVGGKIFGGGYDPKRNLVREIVQMNGTVNVSSPDNDSQEIVANGTPAVALRLMGFDDTLTSDSRPRLSAVIALRLESQHPPSAQSVATRRYLNSLGCKSEVARPTRNEKSRSDDRIVFKRF